MKISTSITKNAFTGGNAGCGKNDLGQNVEISQPLALSSSTEVEAPLPEVTSTVTLTPTPPAMRKIAQPDTILSSDDCFGDLPDLPSPTALVLGGISNGALGDDMSDDWANLDESWMEPTTPNRTANDAYKSKSIDAMHQQTESMAVDRRATKNRHSKRPLPSPDSVGPRSKQTKTLRSNDQLASLSEGLGRGDVLVESTTVNAKPATTEPAKDWEDIDPSLLDEFKDIVNFF